MIFPEWSVATSAFWNLVWAVKYGKRGKPEVADESVAVACDKLQVDTVSFSNEGVRALLVRLADTGDVDGDLIAKLPQRGAREPAVTEHRTHTCAEDNRTVRTGEVALHAGAFRGL